MISSVCGRMGNRKGFRMNRPIRFVIVGSGWRAMYYARAARALPGKFELCAMLCRTQEKADRIVREMNIHTTLSVQECIAAEPDFAVIAVSRKQIAEVSREWMDRGITVLAETPAGDDMETLESLYQLWRKGKKIVTAEQYRFYPEHTARKKLIDTGLIGMPDYLYFSAAHDYHGISLIRSYLNTEAGVPFEVAAKTWRYTSVETHSRYEIFTDGRKAEKPRTCALISFENGRGAVYDFDSDQYRSPIRQNLIKLQGTRGELINDTVYWLDETYQPQSGALEVHTCTSERPEENPNLRIAEEVTEILWNGEHLYQAPFGRCGLSQDETAIAVMMEQTGRYAREEADTPYSFYEALQDAYFAICLRKAAEGGRTVYGNWDIKEKP